VVYAMAAFHFVSGIIRNDIRLLTLSVTVVFLYGGMVWGMFPINPDVSWEGHLWGAISGVALAWHYRKYIIRRDKFDWEGEEEEELEEGADQGGGKEEEDGGEGEDTDSKQVEKPEEIILSHKTPSEIKRPNNVSHTGEF